MGGKVVSEDEALAVAKDALLYSLQQIQIGGTLIENNQYSELLFRLMAKAISDIGLRGQIKAQAKENILDANEDVAYYESVIAISSANKAGNCEEMALQAFDYVLNSGKEINAEVVYIAGGDHVFVVVNRDPKSNIEDPATWGGAAYFSDRWAGEVFKDKDYLTKLKSFYRENNKNHIEDFDPVKKSDLFLMTSEDDPQINSDHSHLRLYRKNNQFIYYVNGKPQVISNKELSEENRNALIALFQEDIDDKNAFKGKSLNTIPTLTPSDKQACEAILAITSQRSHSRPHRLQRKGNYDITLFRKMRRVDKLKSNFVNESNKLIEELSKHSNYLEQIEKALKQNGKKNPEVTSIGSLISNQIEETKKLMIEILNSVKSSCRDLSETNYRETRSELYKTIKDSKMSIDSLVTMQKENISATLENAQIPEKIKKLAKNNPTTVSVSLLDNEEILLKAVKEDEQDLDVIKDLVSRGLNINNAYSDYDSDNGNFTALMFASELGRIETVDYLLKEGAYVNYVNNTGTNALILATDKGHSQVVERLIDAGADVNFIVEGIEDTPLISALLNSHFDIAEYLMKKGANVNAENKEGDTPLIIAARKGKLEMVQSLIEKGAQIDALNQEDESAFIHAITSGHVDIAKYLIEKGANVNAANNQGDTPLIIASKKGNFEIVLSLIEKGAQVDALNNDQDSALTKAIMFGHFQIVEHLVEKCNANIYPTGVPLLALASLQGHLEIVDYLIKKGLNVNQTEGELNVTSLMFAARNGKLNVVECLLKNGAELDRRDENNETALTYAVKNNQIDIVKYLVEQQADVHIGNNNGTTLLMYAAEKDDLELIKLLLKNDAKVDVTDQNGLSALDYADSANADQAFYYLKGVDSTNQFYKTIEEGELNEIAKLIANGVDVNVKNHLGQTPLMHAAGHGQLEVVNLLINHGAELNAVDINGKTALDYAKLNNQTITVHNLQNVSIYEAIPGGDFDIIQKLIQDGANVNLATNTSGMTPLMAAALEDQFEIVKLLIENGAEVDTCDSAGDTVLVYAEENNAEEIIEYIKNIQFYNAILTNDFAKALELIQDVDVNFKYKEMTPLLLAEKNGNVAITTLLLENGAVDNQLPSIKNNKSMLFSHVIPPTPLATSQKTMKEVNTDEINDMVKPTLATSKKEPP